MSKVAGEEMGPAAAFDQARIGNPEARKLDSYPLFDWLRFALASVVALDHEGLTFPGPINGTLAVDVFLALSGWLIGGILLRSHRSDLPRFFFNRATRIWLPYAATAILIYGLAAARDGIDLNWLKYLFYDLTFTHYTFTVFPRAGAEMPLGATGNHFWSISVEEQFYLFAPVLMFLLPWGKRVFPWVILALVLLAMGSIFTPILLGVIAAMVKRDHGDWHLNPKARLIVPLVTIAFFAAMWRWNLPQIHAFFAVSLVLALAVPGRRRAVGLWLGAVSYPFYLNHWTGAFVIHAVEKHSFTLPHLPEILAMYLCGLAISAVAWAAIDRPVMARRGAWFNPPLGRSLGITAYLLLVVGLTGGMAIRLSGG